MGSAEGAGGCHAAGVMNTGAQLHARSSLSPVNGGRIRPRTWVEQPERLEIGQISKFRLVPSSLYGYPLWLA